MPWVSRSGLMASIEVSGTDPRELFSKIETRITELVEDWVNEADRSLPIIFTAHASVEGAIFGAERMVMLGADLVLPTSLVKDNRLDYVALGHIHKPQDLNEGYHPPVIYPGSIERVDFGEAKDDKYFVIAEITRGSTTVDWRKIDGTRPFIERRAALQSSENVTEFLTFNLPHPQEMDGAIVRLTVEYPRELDVLIDESALRKYAEGCFEFHLVKKPRVEARVRIPEGQAISSLSPLDLLAQYFDSAKINDVEDLREMARQIIFQDEPEDL
jgi:exonuclease SbcD